MLPQDPGASVPWPSATRGLENVSADLPWPAPMAEGHAAGGALRGKARHDEADRAWPHLEPFDQRRSSHAGEENEERVIRPIARLDEVPAATENGRHSALSPPFVLGRLWAWIADSCSGTRRGLSRLATSPSRTALCEPPCACSRAPAGHGNRASSVQGSMMLRRSAAYISMFKPARLAQGGVAHMAGRQGSLRFGRSGLQKQNVQCISMCALQKMRR